MSENKSMQNASEILLRRKHKVLLPTMELGDNYGHNADHKSSMVLAIAKNIEAYGFSFSPELIQYLLRFSKEELVNFYYSFMPNLRKLVAADVEYRPMYPNFPQQVAEMDDTELFVNAIVHYFTFGRWLPEYEKSDRLPLIDCTNLVVLTPGFENDLFELFENLVSSKTSLSSQDRMDIETILGENNTYISKLACDIPMKENIALVAKLSMKYCPLGMPDTIKKHFSTATDVLRLVVSMSDGDISLAKPTNYVHLHRPQRRQIMDLLVQCGNITEDLFRYRDEWIRIGEILHVGEFGKDRKYDRVVKAFSILRNDKKPLMFGGKIEAAVQSKLDENILLAAQMLMKRPGEFARRLDKLLRDSTRPDEVLSRFETVASKVASPVLLQVRTHFMARMSDARLPVRVFFPKGRLARVVAVENHLPSIPRAVCARVVTICDNALHEMYSQRPAMGKVYIDPEFEKFLVPFSQRSASSGNKQLVRGSRVAVDPNAKTIRSFIWWTNMNDGGDYWDNRIDIDLSVCILDKDLNYAGHISYTHLRDHSAGAYHSGDITDGGVSSGKGVAEFIDIDIEAAKSRGRYVCFQVYSYTRQKFSQMPNCRFGWMEREDVLSGEVFEPSTVEMCIDLKSESVVSIPVLFDCYTHEFIWLDICMGMNGFTDVRSNNIENNLSGVKAVCYAMLNFRKADLFTLVSLNAFARGEIVYSRDDADIIFSNNLEKPVEKIPVQNNEAYDIAMYEVQERDVPIISAYDLDYYMSQLL